MELHSDYEVQCEKYLLGELSEDDSQQVEEAYFADDSLFERFVAVKEELIDAYARGLLTGNKRKHFEKRFLAGEVRREEIEDARQLIRVTTALPHDDAYQKASPTPTNQRHSLWNWLFGRSILVPVSALTTLVIVAFGTWVLLRNRPNIVQKENGQANQNIPANPGEGNSSGERKATVQATPQSSPAERGTAKQTSVGSDSERPIGPAPTTGLKFGGQRGKARRIRSTAPEQVASRISAEETVALVIEPRSSRSITPTPTPTPTGTPTRSELGFALKTSPVGREPTLRLNSNAKSVQLSLVYRYPVEGPVDVAISDMESREIVSVHDLKVQSDGTKKLVTFKFPASSLKRNDHIARLSTRTKEGTSETIAEYYFTVIRKGPTRTGPRKQ